MASKLKIPGGATIPDQRPPEPDEDDEPATVIHRLTDDEADVLASDTLRGGAVPVDIEESSDPAELTSLDLAVVAGLAPEPPRAPAVIDPAEAPPAVAFQGLLDEKTPPPRKTFARWRLRVRSGGEEKRSYGRDLALAAILLVVLGAVMLRDRNTQLLVFGEDIVATPPKPHVPQSWKDQPLERLAAKPADPEPAPHEPLPPTTFTAPKHADAAPKPNQIYYDESYNPKDPKGEHERERARKTGKPPAHYFHPIKRKADDPPQSVEPAKVAPTRAVQEQPAKPIEPPKEPERPAQAAKAGAMLTIMSQPAGALVELDGVIVGKTPFVQPAPQGRTSFDVRLLLEGKKIWTGTLTPNEAGHFSLSAKL